jgi:hypothetical protein
MSGSWKTTVIGIVGGIVNYFVALGPNLPSDGAGWGVALVSAFLAALGMASKDANVSNSGHPVAVAQPVPKE